MRPIHIIFVVSCCSCQSCLPAMPFVRSKRLVRTNWCLTPIVVKGDNRQVSSFNKETLAKYHQSIIKSITKCHKKCHQSTLWPPVFTPLQQFPVLVTAKLWLEWRFFVVKRLVKSSSGQLKTNQMSALSLKSLWSSLAALLDYLSGTSLYCTFSRKTIKSIKLMVFCFETHKNSLV